MALPSRADPTLRWHGASSRHPDPGDAYGHTGDANRRMSTAAAEAPVPRPLEADLSLLPTKLSRPRVPPTYVPRPLVDVMLDAGTARPLTVVSAGAGWGKTLATAAWAGRGPAVGPVAWVSL